MILLSFAALYNGINITYSYHLAHI